MQKKEKKFTTLYLKKKAYNFFTLLFYFF
jgi:hypothetical protein